MERSGLPTVGAQYFLLPPPPFRLYCAATLNLICDRVPVTGSETIKAVHLRRSLLLIVIVTALGLFTNSFAQSERDKPTLKDFGSSLKKFKWDPEKNQTVINEQGSHDGSDVDVIRIETSLVTSDVLVT